MRTTLSGAASTPVFGRLKPNCIRASPIHPAARGSADSLRRYRCYGRAQISEQAELSSRRPYEDVEFDAGIAGFGVAEALRVVLRAAVLRAGALRAVFLRAVVLRAVVLRAVFLRAVVLRAVVLRAVVLRAVVLRAVVLRAVFLRAVVLRAAVLRRVVVAI